MENESEPYAVVITFSDITELKRAEKAAVGAAREWQTTFDASRDGIWVLDWQHRVLRANKAAEALFGQSKDKMIGEYCWRIMHDTSQSHPQCPAVKARQSLNRETLEFENGGRWFLVTADPILDARGRYAGAVHIISDITDRKREEMEREKMQARLLQVQKMESIGRLAGGVAHDFNNMLSVILGYTEMALESVAPAAPLHGDLLEIYKAANRSTAVTRQLLAFARKQTIAPVVIDLNETIEGMLKMLRRLIGEDIELLWKPGKVRLPVKMDPSQIDQILANLCVNARDAIHDVGRITIETESDRFDAAYCADHPGFLPGDFIRLAVADNGSGMDAEMLTNIFEPFFTTKGVGEGTGLGLSTVYGIVQQNNGFIDVWSEPGQGTCFTIYLPRYAGRSVELPPESAHEMPLGQGETILVAEDDRSMLHLCERMLKEQIGRAHV
jgi:PAS domain S-box-containing protein